MTRLEDCAHFWSVPCHRNGDKVSKMLKKSIVDILVWAYETWKMAKVSKMFTHFFELGELKNSER